MKRWAVAVLLCALISTTFAADSPLRDGDHVAICGDSITEQKLYSLFIEDYLLMCQPKAKLTATQFGWGGEVAPGFLGRMDNDVLRHRKLDVATTFYGMNDGGYSPMTPEKAQKYRDAQSGIIDKLKQAGLHTIVLGSPGCVDTFYFQKDPAKSSMYNKTLSELRDIDRKLAEEKGVIFADVFDTMMETMARAKEKLGKEYDVAGTDGVHPNRNGHLIIAYAFLKSLGCDGDIGTIKLDLSAGKGEASDGHKIVSHEGSKFEIESTRYPFCFTTEGKPSEQTAQIVEFFPFNQDLNRLNLVVTGGGSDKLKVTWGGESKEFAAADLAKGINLAAEFVKNPFSEPFANVEAKIREEQNQQTPLMKEVAHNLPRMEQLLPDQKDLADQFARAAVEKTAPLTKAAKSAVKPVRHTITVEAVK